LAEAVTADDEGMGMVGEAIQGGTDQQVVGKDFAPLFEGAVGGNDQGGAFIAFGDDFVQVLRTLRGGRLETEIIQDQQAARQEAGEEAGVGTIGASDLQLLEQMMGGLAQDPEIAFQCFECQRISQMTFSNSAGTAHQNIFVALDKDTGGQVLDQNAVAAGRAPGNKLEHTTPSSTSDDIATPPPNARTGCLRFPPNLQSCAPVSECDDR